MLDSCNKSLEYKPDDVTALNGKAVSLGFLKNDEALECSDKAIKIDPKDVAAWTNRGLILSALKEI